MNTTLKAKLIEMKITGITIDPFTNAPIVILKGRDDSSIVLPIWIGALEASAIAAEMEEVKFARPMTHDLIKALMNKTKTKVERVEINDLVDNVYYANIFMEDNNGYAHCLDSRPSDAIAVALRMAAPILVSIDVIERSENIGQGSKEQSQSVSDVKNETAGPEAASDMLKDLGPEAFGKYKM